MTRKYFVTVGNLSSESDAVHLIEAVRSLKLDPEMRGELAQEVVLSVTSRDLSEHGYKAVREFIAKTQKAGAMVSAMVFGPVVSVPVLCALAEAEAIQLQDGIKLDMDIDIEHPSFTECRDFYAFLSSRAWGALLGDQDTILHAVTSHLQTAVYQSVGFCADPEMTIFEKQLMCESDASFSAAQVNTGWAQDPSFA